MSRQVPYLAEEAIERDAAALLAKFEHARGITLEPPIPIEDIVEKHLGLSIDFADLHARHNVPRPENGQTDILGAIYSDGSIFIDEALDPHMHPVREGRYFFTLAHECGHWRLHQHLIVRNSPEPLSNGQSPAGFICRTHESRNAVEREADLYAAFLLMPKEMVLRAYEDHFGDLNPRHVELPRKEDLNAYSDPLMKKSINDWRSTEVNYRLNEFSAPLASELGVSAISMRLRLEGLGLLHRVVTHQRRP